MWRIVTNNKCMAAFTAEEFERDFKSLYRPLCLFALRYTEQVDEAEDIVQQAFADSWEKNRESGAISNLKAYLYRAVRNRSLSFVEKTAMLQPASELPDLPDLSDEEDAIYQSERDARLWQAIDCLPSERRRIFLLSKRDGLKYQDIANELHISIKTVENQMGKALKALRDTAVRIYTFFFG